MTIHVAYSRQFQRLHSNLWGVVNLWGHLWGQSLEMSIFVLNFRRLASK